MSGGGDDLHSSYPNRNQFLNGYDGRQWPLFSERVRHGDCLRMTCERPDINIRKPITSASLREQATMLKEQIQGNIEVIDYLREISSLEGDFSSLANRITNTAVKLSKPNNLNYGNRVYNEETGTNVDKCWKYVKQLSNAINWHIKQAFRYHKYHHNVWTAHVELLQLLENFVKMEEDILLNGTNLLNALDIHTIQRLIIEQLLSYDKLIRKASEFTINSKSITPIHKRLNLSPGRHSASLLTSIRLSGDRCLHRGESVNVWTDNQLNNLEWNLESVDGIKLSNVPAVCCWLNSPEQSPNLMSKQPTMETVEQLIVYLKHKLHGIKSNYTNQQMEMNVKGVAKNFNEDLLCALDNTLRGIINLILPNCFGHTKELLPSNEDVPILVDDVNECETFIVNVHSFLNYVDNPTLLDILEKLTQSPICRNHEKLTGQDELNRKLYATVKEWKKLDNLNEAAKQEYFVNWTSSQTKRPDVSTDHMYSVMNMKRSASISNDLNISPINKLDELITNFTNEAPRTYSLADDEPIRYGLNGPIRKKTTRSTPNGANVATTTDLMTQIDTPCFSCGHSKYIDGDEDALSGSHYRYYYSRDPLIRDSGDFHSPQSAYEPSGSLPTLPVSVQDAGVGDDEPMSSVTPSKLKKRLSRVAKSSTGRKLSKSKSMNIGQGYAETTGSSGFESASDSTSRLREYSQSDVNRPARKSFLRWYKRDKPLPHSVHRSITPESPINEPGPPGRRSPINLQTMKYHKKYQQQSPVEHLSDRRQLSVDGRMLRSQSWIQYGVPIGCRPVNCNSWSVSNAPTTEDVQKRWGQLFQSDTQIFGTVDSGIQTDVELQTTRSDITIDKEQSRQMQNISNPNSLNEVRETQTDLFTQKSLYNACCQVGIVTDSQITETNPDYLQLTKPIVDIKSQSVSIQTDSPQLQSILPVVAASVSSEVKPSAKLKQYKTYFEVSCQVGPNYMSTKCGTESKDLNEYISCQNLKMSTPSMRTITSSDSASTPLISSSKKIGKKLQVCIKDKQMSKNPINRACSPIDEIINQSEQSIYPIHTQPIEMLMVKESVGNVVCKRVDNSTSCDNLPKFEQTSKVIVKNFKDACEQAILNENHILRDDKSILTDLPYLYVNKTVKPLNNYSQNYEKSVKVVHVPRCMEDMSCILNNGNNIYYEIDHGVHKSTQSRYRSNFLLPVKHHHISLTRPAKQLLFNIGIYELCDLSDPDELNSSSSENDSRNICKTCRANRSSRSKVRMQIDMNGKHITYSTSGNRKDKCKKTSCLKPRSYSLDDVRIILRRRRERLVKVHSKQLVHGKKVVEIY